MKTRTLIEMLRLPSKCPSCIHIPNFNHFYGILKEICLFKKYMKKVNNLSFDPICISQMICIHFIPLESPRNHLFNNIY